MKLIQGIDFFYHDHNRNLVILGYQELMCGAQQSSADLLSLLCEANGRSVKGSMELFAKINQAHQKLAVLVNPARQEIYFPTHAASNSRCIWLNYGRIQRIEVDEENQCVVHFTDDSQLTVSCSVRVVSRQMERCRNLLDSLGNPYEQINDLFFKI